MTFKATSVAVLALCAAQLSAQTAPSGHSMPNAMAEHTTPGTLVTMAQWTERMHRALAGKLYCPEPMMGRDAGTGTVRVKFNCSDSGRPDKVLLLKTSGNAMLDRAALTAVRRMASLHPLPTGFLQSQKFEALIVFARDSSDRALASMEKEELKRNGWYHDPLMASKTPGGSPSSDAETASAR